MQRGWDRRLVGQTRVLALDGVRMLVGVTAIVVATSVPKMELNSRNLVNIMNPKNKLRMYFNTAMINSFVITHAPPCRLASCGQKIEGVRERCSSYRTAAARPLERLRLLLSLCM